MEQWTSVLYHLVHTGVRAAKYYWRQPCRAMKTCDCQKHLTTHRGNQFQIDCVDHCTCKQENRKVGAWKVRTVQWFSMVNFHNREGRRLNSTNRILELIWDTMPFDHSTQNPILVPQPHQHTVQTCVFHSDEPEEFPSEISDFSVSDKLQGVKVLVKP